MSATFESFLTQARELKALSGVVGLCSWDQETYLPPKAADARAEQLATLQGLYHARLVDPALGALLAGLPPGAGGPDGQAMRRVLEWERARALRVPTALVQALARAQSRSLQAWRRAREEDDFSRFLPELERLLDLRREQAEALGHEGNPYDALLEGFEPGMRVARLAPVLTSLGAKLSERVRAWTRPLPKAWAGARFDAAAQWRMGRRVLEQMGFDFEAGRLDESIHPFTGGSHPTDVRLTLRLEDDTPLPALFGALHEGGHGLYEQGFDPAHFGTPLAQSPSMGLHESQSRLWENQVGRGRAAAPFLHRLLTELFPEQMRGLSVRGFTAEVNRVEPSLVRVEADEVTYNLHIVLRFELEEALLRGDLAPADLPEAWNAKMERLLGLSPPGPKLGVLQDIHWAWGEFGYFPTYALGNLYAASLFHAAQRALPGLDGQLERGEWLPLRDFLRANVHRHGFREPAERRVEAVCGRGLTDEDFISYLDAKYEEART